MLRAQSGDGGGSPASPRSQQRGAQKASRRTATATPTPMAGEGGGGDGTASLAGTTTGAAVDVEALKQWSGTGRLKRSYAPSHHRKYRLGRWQSRSASSWNPPGNASISIGHQPPMVSGSAREASQSRRSLLSIDISHKPSESRRASITSIHSTAPYPPTMLQPHHASDVDDDAGGYDYDDIGDDHDDIGSDGPLAQLLLRENDEIWNNQAFRFTFYSPNTGTVRATDVRKLRTDDASGLDALIRQALDGGNDGSTASSSSSSKSSSGHSKDEAHADRAASASASGGPSDGNHRVVADTFYPVPPQLSVTSADSVVDLTSGGDAAPRRAPGNEFLHPNYIRTQFSHQKSRAEPRDDGSAQPDDDDDDNGTDPSNTSSSPFPALPEVNNSNSKDDAGGVQPKVYWLDIMNPTDGEITALSHIFNLHPLTTEELLLMREHGLSQDNHKSFRHYDVICYRTSMGTLPDPEPQVDTGSSASLNDGDGGSDADCEDDTCSGGDGVSSHVGCCCAKHMPSKRRSFVRDIAHRVQSPWDDDARNRSTMVVDQRPEDKEEKRRPGDAISSVSGIHQRTTTVGRPRKPKRPAPLAGLQRRFASLFSRSSRRRQGAGDGTNTINNNQLSLHQDLGSSPSDETLEEPAPLYVLVFGDCVITLHYHSVPHVRNTVARLKLDEDLVRITPDYIAYLLLDDITDTLVPTTRLLELEVDAIDELVLILTRAEHDDVLKRIGIERRHALWLVRLMHGKAEVLRAIERRVQAKMGISASSSSASATTAPTAAAAPPSSQVAGKRKTPRSAARDDGAVLSGSAYYSDPEDADRYADSDADALESQLLTSDEEEGDLYEWARKTDGADGYGRRNTTAARGNKLNQEQQQQQLVPDVIKYLADVHDHLIALTASVHHCERILARAHGNYLARINLELTHASNTTNQLATQMTVLAGIFLPLNLVAGIFGMNVKVPGRDRNDLRDFGLILGGMALFVILALAVCRWRRII
ncbi:CorA metal ion transporter [Coemansia sp. RSA 1939]|nr:CorA metal ion transporter [Coemansia sp. RSA 1939]KAJ2604721.1 CorA metal ion transporter [Coemansia sp. RSA 1804]KAJ2692631.1 CorA metal ion transporter [Coemansia sp. RSA 1285]